MFQIAAHEDVVPLETLYEYCRQARKILTGKHGVGRVIAKALRGRVSELPEDARTATIFLLEPPWNHHAGCSQGEGTGYHRRREDL